MTFEAPNTFSHPNWLRAIMAQVPGGVIVNVPETGFPKLSTALQKRSLPVKYFESWLTPLNPTGLPFVATFPAVGHVADLFKILEAPVLLRNLPVQHATTQAILKTATHQHVLQSWERSGLALNGNFADWLTNNFDHKRRKELKRLRARLSELGNLTVEVLSPTGDFRPFADNFLALESAGWKGARGTAIGNEPAIAKALISGLEAMHHSRALRFWQMSLDGKPVASLFALIDGTEAALGKIAHDEAFAKFSPGVLIILEATQSLMNEEAVTFADSNAIPGHPMIDRIWRDRIACIDVLVAGAAVPSPVFACLVFFLGTKNAMLGFAKRIFLRVTRRKRS